MPPAQHSAFSASASARLLACPGSYELGLRANTGRKSSIYSAEGTLAHAIGEACLLAGVEPDSFLGQTRTADGFSFTIGEDFVEAVQVYVDYVRGLIALGYAVAMETTVTPTHQWDGLPELPVHLFGTADVIAYHQERRHVVIADLKFGAGVPVEVDGNTQFLYYASGAIAPSTLTALFGPGAGAVDAVRLAVIQPRAFHRDGPIRSQDLTPAEVRTWARTELYPGVKRALADYGKTLSAGKHCRFCPVLPGCEKPASLSFDTARDAFLGAALENLPDPATVQGDLSAALPAHELSDDKLADLLDRIEVITPWLAAVKSLALERAEAGRTPPGYKLVPKRALRRWAEEDEAALLNALADTGLHPDNYTTAKPLTPAMVERRIGKDAYEANVAPLVVKTSSGNTLAPEGDPRSRIQRQTAQEAFANNPHSLEN
jgi:hypothetical protein